MKLISFFDTTEGRYLARELDQLTKKYLLPDDRLVDYMKTFDGTGAKGVIAEITLHSVREITPEDKMKIQEIYSFFC